MDKNRGIDTKLPGTERKMKLNYDKAQLEAVVDKVAERTMNMDMTPLQPVYPSSLIPSLVFFKNKNILIFFLHQVF